MKTETRTNRRQSASRRKHGMATLWLALMMIPMTGLVGVAIDTGRVALIRYELQNYVDAKATAAIREKFGTSQKIEAPQFLGKLAGSLQAKVGEAGGKIGAFDFADRKYKGLLVSLPPRGVPAVAAKVDDFPVKLMFGPLFGLTDTKLSASAVAYSPRRQIIIVQDLSGSMLSDNPPRIVQARNALTALVDTLSAQSMPGDELGLVIFADSAKTLTPLGPLQGHEGALKAAIASMQADGSNGVGQLTNQKAGIDLAMTLWKPGFPQEVARIILVVTDGVPTVPSSDPAPHIAAADAACASATFQKTSVQGVFISSTSTPQAQKFIDDLVCGPLGASLAGTPAGLQGMLSKLIAKVPARLVQ